MNNPTHSFDRRRFLSALGAGFGGVAFSQLMARETSGLLSGSLHHPARAKRVIQLFMNGGASQMDLFDYKPALFKHHGEVFSPGDGQRIEAPTSEPGKVLKPMFGLQQHGKSGRWVSELMPHLAKCVDDLAFLMSMTSRTNVHGPGSYMMNTGFLLPGFPAMGSWVSYALGSESDNLPSFVVLPDARGLPYNQKGNFSAGFLPVTHQGTVINMGATEPLPHMRAPQSARFITSKSDEEGLALLGKLNAQHRTEFPADPRLESRIRSYELAAKMQLSAPEAFDVAKEPEYIRNLYGLDQAGTEDFGKRCLIARRLAERGVRFIQVWSGAGGPTNNWDNHSSIPKELPPMCAATDQPVAALLRDLKARGMLEDTLVLWNTEFGRMPFSQSGEGRDHNGGTFCGWMAGAGVNPGVAIGSSDEWSWKGAEGSVTTYDFHATVLHLLGINHEKLTVKHSGAARRLTDVHGHVIEGVIA